MPDWLLLTVSLLALVSGVLALMRANKVDRAARRALAALPPPGAVPVAPMTVSGSGALRRVAVVRFDAFADVRGQLSSAAALLDDEGNGVVITTMHGRDATRSYIKAVRAQSGLVALSPEEADAVEQAMNR